MHLGPVLLSGDFSHISRLEYARLFKPVTWHVWQQFLGLWPNSFDSRFDADKNKHYRLDGNKGEILLCNSRGVLIKPFDPNLTGKFSYKKRIKIMRQKNPGEAQKDLVEMPHSLESNFKRNYSPQNNLLEGYTQMPRTFN